MTPPKAEAMETADLRSRVVALEQGSQNREARLAAVEAWRTQRDIESARHDERWSHMEKRLDGIEKDIGSIQGTLTWIMRIVIGGILMGVVAFLIKGGFAP